MPKTYIHTCVQLRKENTRCIHGVTYTRTGNNTNPEQSVFAAQNETTRDRTELR